MDIRKIIGSAVVAVVAVFVLDGTANAGTEEWQPGDRVYLPAKALHGTVEASGSTVIWDGGSPTHRWNNTVTVEDAAAMGAQRIGG